jgi:hypothetical protein
VLSTGFIVNEFDDGLFGRPESLDFSAVLFPELSISLIYLVQYYSYDETHENKEHM